MKKVSLWWVIGLVAVLALVAGWFLRQGSHPSTPAPSGGSASSVSAAAETAAQHVSSAFAQPNDLETYNDAKYGFSFAYPKGYTVGAFGDAKSNTVLLQNSSGVGLQLIITPFDENLPVLTEARIRQDLPDLDMRNVTQVQLAGGIKALAFQSSGGGFGQSAELWFIHDSFLYQFSTYESLMPLLQQVADTLSFK